MRNVTMWLRGWTRKFRHLVAAFALLTGLVGIPAVMLVVSATPAAAAAQVNTYSWQSAPCSWTGATTGKCVNQADPSNQNDWYDWGVKTCPSGDGYCQAANEINGYYQYDQWGYQFRNCTSYVAEKISQEFGGRSVAGWGEAGDWATAAQEKQHGGYHLDSSPEVGDIAVWSDSAAPPYGHVAYVYAVSNGVASLDEYNEAETGAFTSSYTSANHYGGAPTSYIHMGIPVTSGGSPILTSSNSLQTPDGYIHVFTGNSTGSVWETWFGNGHSPTSDLLGTPTGSPITSISSMYTSDGYIHVFAGMQSGDIYEFYFGNGNPPKWDLLGNPDGQPITSVSSMQTSDGYIHVFSSTKNGYVWETYFGNGNAPKTDQLANLSGSEVAAITSLQTTDGYIHVFSGNVTGSIWETWFGNGHSPTSDLLGTPDGSAITSVTSMQTSDGYIHVFSTTADGYVWETYFGNGNAPKTDQLANLSG